MSCIPPVIWSFEDGVLVRDLKSSDFPKALDLILSEYLQKNVVSFALNAGKCFNSVAAYIDLLERIMRDGTSLIAIDEENNDKIVGVLLAKVMDQEDYSWSFWKFLTPKEPAVNIMMNFERDMVTNSFTKRKYREPQTSFHVFLCCIAKQYKGSNRKPKLFFDAFKLARSLGMPKISFIAKTLSDQIRAERMGLMEQARICYGEYVSKKGKRLLSNYPHGEYYAIHYEINVGPRCNMSIYEPRYE